MSGHTPHPAGEETTKPNVAERLHTHTCGICLAPLSRLSAATPFSAASAPDPGISTSIAAAAAAASSALSAAAAAAAAEEPAGRSTRGQRKSSTADSVASGSMSTTLEE